MQDGASSEHSVSKRRCDGKANAQEDTVGHATVAAECLDGKACAAEVESELLQRVETLNESNIQPHLAVIIVGDDPASHVYVNAKVRMCERLGIRSTHIALPADTDESVLRQHIETMNQQQDLDGILVQSPLPNHMDEEALTDMIHPSKDVDGFHPINLGLLAMRQPKFRSCTPYGVIKMLKAMEIEVSGKDAVVVGASNHVGRPMAFELLLAGATVTQCHSKTQNIQDKVYNADIVVAAVGRPEMVKGSWIKKGAVVIDIGINRVGDKLIGDVEFEVAKHNASFITPVPGGVGPMTVATLMSNTLDAQKNSL